MRMIPDEEIDRLTTAVDDAIALAAESRIAEGYTLLSAGFLRARCFQEQEAWGEELVERWNLACLTYAETYGPTL